MIQHIQSLLDDYAVWLRDKTSLRQVKDWVEITTPYLDRHNDYIQIYAKKTNGSIILTDDGYTIQDLEQSGCNLKSPRRESLMNVTLKGFGIQRQGDALEVHATNENFSLRKHNLVQAILAVNDMFYLTAPVVANLFYEDVVEWLESNNIRYTPKVKFSGKTGYDHLFDFVIPKSRSQPERIIQTMNRPNRDTAQSLVLSWVDTKEVRSAEAKVYAIMNDTEQKIPHAVVDALTNYGVRPFSWSERETKLEELLD